MSNRYRVSLMGHNYIDGAVTPSALLAGGIDVTDGDSVRTYGPGAVYSIVPLENLVKTTKNPEPVEGVGFRAPPPDGAWFDVPGQGRWASDGRHMIHESVATHAASRWTWDWMGTGGRPFPVDAVANLIDSATTASVPTHARLDRRFADLLASGTSWGESGKGAVAVFRGDQLVAVVMPLRFEAGDPNRDYVNFKGQPWSELE